MSGQQEEPIAGSGRPTLDFSSASLNSSFDFKYEALVDADDPGFDSEFESGQEEDAESDDATDEDEDEDEDEEQFFTRTDNQLRTLAQQLQTEFLKQPKSTQLVLTREALDVYNKSYRQSGGSAARLSVAVIAFLDGGDVVTRPGTRVVEEVELDVFGNRTATPTRQVVQKVVERARLRFTPLPGSAGFDSKMSSAFVSHGKRKASDSSLRGEEGQKDTKRFAGSFGSTAGGHDFGGVRQTGYGSTAPIPIRVGVQRDLGLGVSSGLFRSQDSQSHRQATAAPQPTQQFCLRPNQQRPTPPPQQQQQQQQQQPQEPTILRHIPSYPPPENNHSLTTDPETQALFLGPSPIIPFHPLSDLHISIPQSAHTATLPSRALASLHRILTLHAFGSVRFYNYLVDKYSSTNISSPTDPTSTTQVPAALFRLGIISHLHSDLEDLFTPALSHPLALSPKARNLLRDLYRVSPGRLKGDVEKNLVARAAEVDPDSVEIWWDERNKKRMPWNALRRWMLVRDAEGIRDAKRAGTW